MAEEEKAEDAAEADRAEEAGEATGCKNI